MMNCNLIPKGGAAFERAHSARISQNLADIFRNHYATYGAVPHPHVPVTSGVDETVRFVGSHISVLKPLMKDERLPEKGVYIVQKCIRTHGLATMLDESAPFNWGSMFLSLGVLVPYQQLQASVNRTISLFSEVFGLSKDHICIRISRRDDDLMQAVSGHLDQVVMEMDTMREGYYRHSIGDDSIVGRNFNIALRKTPQEAFADIGNIIVLEKNGVPMFVEVALGTSTILKQLFGLDHVLECHPLPNFGLANTVARRRLEDCIMFASEAYREGLRPSNKHNRNRILKKYLQGLQHYANKLSVPESALQEAIDFYLFNEYGEKGYVASYILDDLKKL